MVTHKDKGCVQVLVILFRVVSVELVGLLAINGEEVGAGIVGPQWVEELFEGGVDQRLRAGQRCVVGTIESVHHFGSSWTRIGLFVELRGRILPSLEIAEVKGKSKQSSCVIDLWPHFFTDRDEVDHLYQLHHTASNIALQCLG